MKECYINGFKIILGQNATENWKIIKDKTYENPNYVWLHLNKFPSGHVVIESESPPQNIIHLAAHFCLHNTKFKNLKNITIVQTHLSNIKLTQVKGEVEFLSNRKTNVFKL